MSNHIVINNQHIELTEEQVKQLSEALNLANTTIKLSDISVGDTFKIGEHELIVLEHSGDTTAVIRKDLLPGAKFGETNNYNGSNVGGICIKFAAEIGDIIGADNIVEHTVDLTSNDGLKDYGSVKSRASLLTADRYRRYVEILDKFKPNKWWWLATPWSTKTHDSDVYVLCVSPSGDISYNNYNCDDGGVRPFCILKSNIFVSK